MKKWSYEEVKQYIESFDYQLLSSKDEIVNINGFVLSSTYLLIKCVSHKPYSVKWSNFKSGKRCPYCAGHIKYSYEEVRGIIENEGYKLLSKEYKNNSTKLLIQCDKRHEYEVTFGSFRQGHRCSICHYEKLSGLYKFTYEQVKNDIESIGYKLLSKEYTGSGDKILIECDKRHEYRTTYNIFRRGCRCPYCAGVIITYEYVKAYIESCGYELLSKEYLNGMEKLLIKCPKGHIINTMNWNSFQQGHRCSICNISKGEQRIMDYLNYNGIEYIYEKTFNGLRGTRGGFLSYDFYLPRYKLLIEYQGEQHKYQIEGFGDLERQQEHDRRKREYAKENNIKLLEIWYWDFDNIEKILREEIK